MAGSPEDKIAAVAPELLLPRRPGILTDPIGIEYALETDPATRSQLAAVRLGAAAQVYRAIAEAAEKAAGIIGAQGT